MQETDKLFWKMCLYFWDDGYGPGNMGMDSINSIIVVMIIYLNVIDIRLVLKIKILICTNVKKKTF